VARTLSLCTTKFKRLPPLPPLDLASQHSGMHLLAHQELLSPISLSTPLTWSSLVSKSKDHYESQHQHPMRANTKVCLMHSSKYTTRREDYQHSTLAYYKIQENQSLIPSSSSYSTTTSAPIVYRKIAPNLPPSPLSMNWESVL
jgi:hypothetical protein